MTITMDNGKLYSILGDAVHANTLRIDHIQAQIDENGANAKLLHSLDIYRKRRDEIRELMDTIPVN